ncbi:MAG: hypothetical protein JW726_15065 [Anaerolineales bacterium]|nr:hypothetical protein [Anaerolineales bacterium]
MINLSAQERSDMVTKALLELKINKPWYMARIFECDGHYCVEFTIYGGQKVTWPDDMPARKNAAHPRPKAKQIIADYPTNILEGSAKNVVPGQPGVSNKLARKKKVRSNIEKRSYSDD